MLIAILYAHLRGAWLKTAPRRLSFATPLIKPSLVSRRRKAAFWQRFAGPLWSVLTSTLPARAKKVARPIFDALSARHQHPQQRHQAQAIRLTPSLDGRSGRHRPLHRIADC